MELNDWQRQVLINQLEILKRLDADNAKAVADYEKGIEALREGHTVDYPIAYLAKEVSRDLYREVCDVLDMYRWVHDYWDKDPTDEEVSKHPFAVFKGFDWNNESEYAGALDAVLAAPERYPSFSRNPPSPIGARMPAYRAMVAKWRDLRDIVQDEITRDQVLEVLEAGRAVRRGG